MAGETGVAILGGILLGGLLIWLALAILSLMAFIFWIFMIIDVVQRKFKHESDKIIWVLVVIFAGIIGALIYYFLVKRHEKKE